MISNLYKVNVTFQAWKVYHGMYMHFTNDTYDFFKYRGKGNWDKISSMEKYFSRFERYGKLSAQRGFFETLGKTYTSRDDLIFFYLSQFTNELLHPDDFDTDLYADYKNRMENFLYYIRLDSLNIVRYMREYESTFNDVFVASGINHPPILKLGLSKTISLETFSVLDMLFNFIPNLNKQLVDPIWDSYQTLVTNYKPFLSVDINAARNVVKEVIYAN